MISLSRLLGRSVAELPPSNHAPALRERSLAALSAWEIYNQEGEALQLNESKGWLGVAAGTVLWGIKKIAGQGNGTALHDQAEKWRIERDLVSAVKGKLLRSEAGSIKDALKIIRETGSAELKDRAEFYLKPEYRAWKGHPLGLLIDFSSEIDPNPETARLLLQRTFELEYQSKAHASGLAIYQLVQKYSSDVSIRKTAQNHIKAHQGESGFGRALEKSVFSSSTESLAADVLVFKGAHRVGNFFSSAAQAIAKHAKLSDAAAWVASKSTGFLAEGHALWAGNTVKSAVEHDAEQVLAQEHLTKSYFANFIMLGITKLFGNTGNVVAVQAAKRLGLIQNEALTLGGKIFTKSSAHIAGLSGMVASTQVNEVVGFKDAPKGGFNESLAQDMVGYAAFGLADPLLSANKASGNKPSEFNVQGWVDNLRSLFLMPGYALLSAGGMGGGGMIPGSKKKHSPSHSEPAGESALLKEIRANGLDDPARLVYEDKLLESGDARAELIEIENNLSQPKNFSSAERKAMRLRRTVVQRQMNAEILKRVDLEPKSVYMSWNRAFIEKIQWKSKQYPGAEKLGAILEMPEAAVNHLLIQTATMPASDFGAFAEQAGLSSVRTLYLQNPKMGNAEIQTLVASPYLHGLKDLSLISRRIGPIGARALAESALLAELNRLHLYAQIGAQGAKSIAESPNAAALTFLNLEHNNIGDAGARSLAWSPHLSGLTLLALPHNSIGDPGGRAFAGPSNLKSLRFLDLSWNTISDSVNREIKNWPFWPKGFRLSSNLMYVPVE